MSTFRAQLAVGALHRSFAWSLTVSKISKGAHESFLRLCLTRRGVSFFACLTHVTNNFAVISSISAAVKMCFGKTKERG